MQSQSGPLALERRINRLAARQHGLIARTQLLALGLGAGAIQYRLTTGRLTLSRRGVYSVGFAAPTREHRWAAAVLASGPGAVISHLSAAAVWGLRHGDPVTIDVSVPCRNTRMRDGVRVHRPRHLTRADTTWRRGIPVTSVPRTLIDLAETVSRRSLERLLDEAEFLKLLDLVALHSALSRHPGRDGTARLSATLRRHQPGTTRTRTPLEEDFFVLVRAAGLPQAEVNVPVGPFTVDFLWRDNKLVVETDGGDSHDRRSQRKRDARRDAWLAAHDYETLRFTWEQVHSYPAEVLAALNAKLRTRR